MQCACNTNPKTSALLWIAVLILGIILTFKLGINWMILSQNNKTLLDREAYYKSQLEQLTSQIEKKVITTETDQTSLVINDTYVRSYELDGKTYDLMINKSGMIDDYWIPYYLYVKGIEDGGFKVAHGIGDINMYEPEIGIKNGKVLLYDARDRVVKVYGERTYIFAMPGYVNVDPNERPTTELDLIASVPLPTFNKWGILGINCPEDKKYCQVLNYRSPGESCHLMFDVDRFKFISPAECYAEGRNGPVLVPFTAN